MTRIKNFSLGILGATILSLGLYACSNDNETTTNNNPTEQTTVAGKESSIQKFYGRIPLPAEFEDDATTNFYAVIDVEKEVVLEYKIDESVTEAYKVDYTELNNYFREDMGSLFTSLNGEPKDDGAKFTDHAGCIEACKDKYIVDGEKQKGLGACKGNCWVDTSVKVIVAIAQGLKK